MTVINELSLAAGRASCSNPNGRRIYVRSGHTGNHCPIGQASPRDRSGSSGPGILPRWLDAVVLSLPLFTHRLTCATGRRRELGNDLLSYPTSRCGP